MSTEATPLLRRRESIFDYVALTRHELAAWIIEKTASGSPVSSRDSVPNDRTGRLAYLFFENSASLRQLAALILIFLSFVEMPSWCSANRACTAPARPQADFHLSGVPYISGRAQMLLNAICLSILVFFVIFDFRHLSKAPFHSKPKLISFVIGALVLDFVYIAYFHGYPPFRFAPYFRALLPLLYWDSVRECTFAIFSVIPPFLNVFSVFAIFVTFVGWLVTLLLHDVPSVDPYFGDLGLGLYSTFTAVITGGWPAQITAIINVSHVFAPIVLLFVILGVFLLFNVLLAVVYNAYTDHMEELVVSKFAARRQSISIAYDVLVEETGRCTLPDVKLLFAELRKNKMCSQVDEQRVGLVFTALDDDSNEQLDREEFQDIVEVMQLKFVLEINSMTLMERCLPRVYSSEQWQAVCRYVRSQSYNYVMYGILLINIAVLIFETTADLRKTVTPKKEILFVSIEAVLAVLYMLDVATKIMCQGLKRYWQTSANRFDCISSSVLMFSTIYTLIPSSKIGHTVVRFLIMLRCLRLLEILADVPRYNRIIKVFATLIPASIPLFTFLFVSIYVFAAAGVECFGGLLFSNNPSIDPKLHPLVLGYIDGNYWVLNFNDMAAGWYSLFLAVLAGYLTDLTEVVASASVYGDWTKWFFVLSFVVNTLLVSNCVLAFVVDIFVMGEENQEDEGADLADLQSRYGSKRVKIHHATASADRVYASMFKKRVQDVLENPVDSDHA